MADLDLVKKKILAKVPLTTLIGESVALSHRGGRPVGCCPFHEEKSPSFYIYDQRYYCFGCKAHGDAIDYIRKTMGLSFMETLRFLAQKYGVDAPELERSHQQWQSHGNDRELYRLMGEAQSFFENQLWSPAGQEARDYLAKRGFSEESQKQLGFGMTPHEGFGLVRYLRQRGYKEQSMVDVSLASSQAENPQRYYDFFRRRIMIPIHDAQGRIVAFGGRALDQDPAKYKNSRETRLFNKSDTLFGFHQARQSIRAKGRVIVVEGYMDALRLWNAGVTEVVACMGTALTLGHMQRLKSMTGLVILVFDGDQAGHRATLKSVDVTLSEPSVTVRAVTLPVGLDPDDVINQQGVEGFDKLLGESVYLLDFAIREKLEGLYPHAVAAVLQEEIIPWLAKVGDPLLRDSLVLRIANQVGTTKEKLAAQLPSAANQKAAQGLDQLAKSGVMQVPGHGHHAGAHSESSPSRAFSPSSHSSPLSQKEIMDMAQSLSPVAGDILGHFYFTESVDQLGDPQALRKEVLESFDLPDQYQAFLDEILFFLARGKIPSDLPAGAWTSTLDPNVSQFKDRLIACKPGFVGRNRLEQIKRALEFQQLENLKKTISSLRSEASRLARAPEKIEDLRHILGSIKLLEQERFIIYQKLQE